MNTILSIPQCTFAGLGPATHSEPRKTSSSMKLSTTCMMKIPSRCSQGQSICSCQRSTRRSIPTSSSNIDLSFCFVFFKQNSPMGHLMSLTESLSRIDDLQEQINNLPSLSEAEITSLRAYYKVKLTYS